MRIDASNLDYRALNQRIHRALSQGEKNLTLENVNGQRYICAGVKGEPTIKVMGIPGNDLGAFMDGPRIDVVGNGQDAIGNTMNSGRIVVRGHAGDVLAYGMRGGELFIRDNVGYRVGIHMKAFRKLRPALVIGGTAKDFLGEYMAGGVIIVLALDEQSAPPAGFYVGSGAHGGTIYVRGKLKEEQLGKEIRRARLDATDRELIKKYLTDFCQTFGLKLSPILNSLFSKYVPLSHRPYGKLYAY